MNLRNILRLVLAMFGWLSVNTPPPPRPVVRCIVNEFTKNAHAKILGIGATMRTLANMVAHFANAPLTMFGYPAHYLNAGVLNLYLDPLPTFPFQAATIKENMPRSVHIRDLVVRITGTLTVSGGTTDGTLQTDPIARLIRRFTVRWDGFDFVVPIAGRDLAALSRRLVAQPLSGTPVTIPGVQTTNFELRFVVPFARSYLADPFNTALPPLVVRKEFVAEIDWEQGASNAVAGTTAGSRAFVVGGDRVVALTNTQCTILPRQARNAGKPWYLPQIGVYETRQYTAANERLPLDMEAVDPFDAVLFRFLEGAEENAVDRLTDLTFQTKSVKILESIPAADLRVLEEAEFPAATQATEAGTHFIRFADGGKLGNVINPAELTLPEFRFNVSAPASNPGIVRAIVMELASVPDVTLR